MAEMDKNLIPHEVEEVLDAGVKDYTPEGIKMIHAPEVWHDDAWGKDVVVAIIDTGIDYNHPDLKDRVKGGKDFTDTGDFMDDNGHGTHVAGTVLASLDNGGVVGVAPKASVLSLKALNAQGQGSSQWVNDALRYAIDQGVDIISMSLGGPANDAEHVLIQEAHSKGIHVVCAAGNSGDGNPNTVEKAYPGAYDEVIEVGAVDFNGDLAKFSNTNDEVDILAPGVGIISTWPGGKYAKLSGTSMATPHVSGAMALVKTLDNLMKARTDKMVLDLTSNRKPAPNPSPNPQPAPKKTITITVGSKDLGLEEKTVEVDW